MSSQDFDDKFFQRGTTIIPWSACLLALELENLGYQLGRGPDPDSLRIRPQSGALELCPEMKQRIRTEKFHLLQVVDLT